jgi:hypothetical protein
MGVLDEVLGVGYTGYAKIGGKYVLMTPSDISEEENLQKSDAPHSTEESTHIGSIPTLDRRALKGSLSFVATPSSVPLIKDLTYGYRNAGISTAPPIPLEIYAANREGYRTDSAYIESVRLDSQPNTLVNITVDFTAWVWEDIFATDSTPRYQKIIDPWAAEHKPIAAWESCANIDATASKEVSWNLTLGNNWVYQQMLEGYTQPPNPRLIYPGHFEVVFSIKWLAKKNDRPKDITDGTIHIGSNPEFTITLPKMVRDPSRKMSGIGEKNSPIHWDAQYYGLGGIPS